MLADDRLGNIWVAVANTSHISVRYLHYFELCKALLGDIREKLV